MISKRGIRSAITLLLFPFGGSLPRLIRGYYGYFIQVVVFVETRGAGHIVIAVRGRGYFVLCYASCTLGVDAAFCGGDSQRCQSHG